MYHRILHSASIVQSLDFPGVVYPVLSKEGRAFLNNFFKVVV